MKVQQHVPAHDADLPPDRAIRFRVGVNVGDVIPDGTDVHGDVVNVAARLQAECPPGGICISRAAREHLRDRLDLTFDELGALDLKNIARPIEAFVLKLDAAACPSEPVEQSLLRVDHEVLPLPDKPSIAVLPFTNMSGDPSQDYFADGTVEEIITALSKIRRFFVIARNSSFAYKGQVIDVKQVGRELGVQYLLEGSVREARGRVRITAQLIESNTGAHLWSNRYEGSLKDIFDLQDDVASGVVGAIEPEIHLAEIARATRKPTNNLVAYDLYLRALFHKLTRESLSETLRLLRCALELDPAYAPAASLVGWCRSIQGVQGWLTRSHSGIAESIALARQAIESGKNDPDALWMAGYTLSFFAGEHALAAKVIERALS